MNWGNRLLLVFIAFGGLMFYLAYRSYHVNVELVEKEYYKSELKYQGVIDGTNRANALSSKIILNLNDQFLTVRFPDEMKNTTVTGTVWFYCANDSRKDRHLDLKINGTAEQQIDRIHFVPGNYTVKIEWRSNKQQYYSEEKLTIL